MKLVLFEPGGSSDSNGGTVMLIDQCWRKFQISVMKNRNFVGKLRFEYIGARSIDSSGVTKGWKNQCMTEPFSRFHFQ